MLAYPYAYHFLFRSHTVLPVMCPKVVAHIYAVPTLSSNVYVLYLLDDYIDAGGWQSKK